MNKVIAILLLAIISCNNLRNLADFDFNTFYNQLVNRHNILRQRHGSGKLEKLEDIANLAQTTANNCKKHECLYHSGTSYNNEWMGQNLYLKGGAAPTGNEVANSWYSENKSYDYIKEEGKNGALVGHFTQLVWKASKKIGCAVAIGPWNGNDPSYYVCCNYFPGGNIQGKYKTNVLKPIY